MMGAATMDAALGWVWTGVGKWCVSSPRRSCMLQISLSPRTTQESAQHRDANKTVSSEQQVHGTRLLGVILVQLRVLRVVLRLSQYVWCTMLMHPGAGC